MAYDEGLAQRIREVLGDDPGVLEKKMFGGLAFMIGGHMTVGITGEDLMARVGPEDYPDALARPGAREMDFTGRALKGFVYVGPEGIEDDEALAGWIARARTFTGSLPPK
jgi:hypothetical protein